MADIKPRSSDNIDNIRSCKFPDIVDSSQLKAVQLPDPLLASKVVQLLYTNSGVALLALASDTMHKLWKWQRTEHNPSGKSSASIKPELWQPATGALMTNYTSDTKPAEESSGCIALSKNDSYLLSASGGKVSLFNMITFKIMTTFMPPPPAATCLAFDPHDNNFCAVGMEDSTIQIYSVRVDEVKAKLKGHQKQITGLAFSQALDILVSAGADAQLCIWDTEGWEKKKARPIQAPPGHPSPLVGETKVQFHNDQTHLLVVHESQIAVYDSQLGCLQSVVQLLYTNSGVALLALASDTMHKLWKWQRTEHNPSGKSSASIKPELWQPATKNDSYLLSASGGKVSLFNMITFKIMTTFMPPPPAATCLAFDPHDNNFCAVGMEDSTTQIYSVRVDEWYPRDSLSAPISTAIYSCDGLVVFTGFLDGAIGVFDADNFRLRCWIAPSAYISSSPIASNKGSGFPVVIAAHPFEPNQIALGMSNGAVHVIEPSDAEPECVGSRMVP
ncbi:unnamed protein product [Camellia sinensis]